MTEPTTQEAALSRALARIPTLWGGPGLGEDATYELVKRLAAKGVTSVVLNEALDRLLLVRRSTPNVPAVLQMVAECQRKAKEVPPGPPPFYAVDDAVRAIRRKSGGEDALLAWMERTVEQRNPALSRMEWMDLCRRYAVEPTALRPYFDAGSISPSLADRDHFQRWYASFRAALEERQPSRQAPTPERDFTEGRHAPDPEKDAVPFARRELMWRITRP